LAMLLASPEPFDWERIDLEMSVIPSIIGPGVGIVTIDTVPDAGPDGLTVSNVTVTLRFSRNIDLSGWLLRAYIPVAGADDPLLREFRFGPGSVYTRGSRVTVRADATPRWRPSLIQRLISRLRRVLFRFFGWGRGDVPDLTLRDPS